MKILQKGIMPDGTEIQIEEWHENYNFMPYGSTVVSYLDNPFRPRIGDKYRFSFDFNTGEDAKKAFNDLLLGIKSLSDFKENFSGRREYLNFL